MLIFFLENLHVYVKKPPRNDGAIFEPKEPRSQGQIREKPAFSRVLSDHFCAPQRSMDLFIFPLSLDLRL